MKPNILKSTIWAFVLTVIPFAYLAYLWDTMPEVFVFNNGKADIIRSKEQILEQLINTAIIGLAFYFVMAYYKTYDPLQSIARSKNLLIKFGLTCVAFLSALSVYNIHSAIHREPNNFFFITTGLMIAAFGNLMHSLPFRHPLGLRLPWALANEGNWRKTHRLASKIYFFAGLAAVATALFVPKIRIEPWVMCLLLMPMLVPNIYSYLLSKNIVR